jgi:hypothetical protein
MKILQTLAILVLFGAASGYSGTKNSDIIEESFDASNVSLLDVRTFGGSLTIIGEDRSDISMKAERIVRHADVSQFKEILKQIEMEVDTRQDGLYISFEYEKNHSGSWSFFGFGRRSPSVSVNVEIRAPKTIAQHLKTSGGHITVKNIHAYVRARTSGGHIDLDTIYGSSEVKTSGGHIDLKNMRGPVKARTSGGHIKANFPEGLSSDTSLKTSGGGIKVYLPSDEGFHLVAKTSAGHIKTDFPIEVTGKFITNAAVGDVNGGGPELQLHTSAGGIKINKL